MTIETIISGFGGQGVMSLGELLTYGGMHEGREVSWLPSYGPEMRGGSASCQVIVSDEPVGSPIISEADAVLAASVFHFGELTVRQVKEHMASQGIPVRM